MRGLGDCAWNNCGCSTVYTDAWGNVINGTNSGADGSTPVTSAATGCALDWSILAFIGVAGVIGVLMASGKV